MISSLLLRISVVLLLVGLVAGIAMGVTQNFTYVPAHAHLNLVGGVLMFLAGLYYRLVPEAGASALAKVQGTLHIAAAIVFPIGIAAVLTNPKYELLAIAGAFIVLAAIATFAVIVFRTSTARA
jgi:hypothetical protein